MSYFGFRNKIRPIEKDKYSIFKDIYNLVLIFSRIYKLKFDINLLVQDDKNCIENLKNIGDELLEDILDVTFNNENLNNLNKGIINNNENDKENSEWVILYDNKEEGLDDEKGEDEDGKEIEDKLEEVMEEISPEKEVYDFDENEGEEDYSPFMINQERPNKRKYLYLISLKLYIILNLKKRKNISFIINSFILLINN